jgi:hypothetical protein
MDHAERIKQIAETARHYRNVCLESVGLPKYRVIADDLHRWASMWERFARQAEEDARRITESRSFIDTIDDRLKPT